MNRVFRAPFLQAHFEFDTDSSGSEEMIYANPSVTQAGLVGNDMSPDGKYLLLFQSLGTPTGYDVFVLPVDGDRKPVAIVQGPTLDAETQFSPDGHWVSYYSMDSGNCEVFVQPFPGGRQASGVDRRRPSGDLAGRREGTVLRHGRAQTHGGGRHATRKRA